MANAYIVQRDDATYDESCVRHMIDTLLHQMHYDDAHFGTEEWNPLANLIARGDNVVIKPNLVMHKNEDSRIQTDAIECLVTQTPCIKVICDYALKALDGTGQIIIGDAPMQGCNFNDLVTKMGLRALVEDYQRKGLSVELKDFREYEAKVNSQAVRVSKRYTGSEGVVVHLGEKSLHCASNSNEEYQVGDYDIRETMRLHHDKVHDYVVAKDILEADVIINFCKPKTHRLAGFTAAMKNMVGCTYNKASLPHRTAGSVAEGGDAYLYKSAFKRAADWALTQKIRAENTGHLVRATAFRYVYGANLVTARRFGKDKYYIGSWYGNDTIWRTVCDLNYIVLHADKEGVLHDAPIRKMLSMGDLIVAGQGNGPVKPKPKYLGALIASEDAQVFDLAACRIMGFEFDDVPLARYLQRQINGELVYINGEGNALESFEAPESWHFAPHESWLKRPTQHNMPRNGPIRVLCVFSTLDRGGAETMCMNLYRHIDCNKVQFDFVKHTHERGAFEDEIESLGGRVYEAPRYKMYNQLQYDSWWRNHLKAHPEHQIIHGHYFTISAVYFRVCKQMGRTTIAHIHASAMRNRVQDALVERIPEFADYSFACSDEAGRWIYGDRQYVVINNALDCEEFRFDEAKRIEIRQSLGLGDELVLGTVANMSPVKNPMGLIDVFLATKRLCPGAKLLWVGTGKLRGTVEERLAQEGIDGDVLLLGQRGDVPELLQAMDAFLLPSLNEGLPMSLIEAQAAGLRCYVSERVTREADITGRCEFLAIERPEVWALALRHASLEHVQTRDAVKRAGYDVRSAADAMQEFYTFVAADYHQVEVF